MSHHRETVTAVGAPQAAGPYSHAVKSGGLIFLSGQTPIDPDTGKLVEGDIGVQTKRCLDNLAVVAAAADRVMEAMRAHGYPAQALE
jgi:2-iminobutanoate/2-iminopropanoate deaminase